MRDSEGDAAFGRKLLEFTLTRKCSANWMRATLEWVQRYCLHDPAHVVADVTDGDRLPLLTRHCRTCGAVWREVSDAR